MMMLFAVLVTLVAGFALGFATGNALAASAKPKIPQCDETVQIKLIDGWGTSGGQIRVQCGLLEEHDGLCAANGQGLYDTFRWLAHEDGDKMHIQRER